MYQPWFSIGFAGVISLPYNGPGGPFLNDWLDRTTMAVTSWGAAIGHDPGPPPRTESHRSTWTVTADSRTQRLTMWLECVCGSRSSHDQTVWRRLYKVPMKCYYRPYRPNAGAPWWLQLNRPNVIDREQCLRLSSCELKLLYHLVSRSSEKQLDILTSQFLYSWGGRCPAQKLPREQWTKGPLVS